MSEYHDYTAPDWRLSLVVVTPSMNAYFPTVRLIVNHGAIAQAIDLPAGAMEWLGEHAALFAESAVAVNKASYGGVANRREVAGLRQ